jgi:hypothetical protein
VRRVFRLILFAAAVTGLIKLARNLLEELEGQLEGGLAAADLQLPQESSKGGAESSGAREARAGPAEPSKAQLYERAKALDIEGRSKMSKSELERAVAESEGAG